MYRLLMNTWLLQPEGELSLSAVCSVRIRRGDGSAIYTSLLEPIPNNFYGQKPHSFYKIHLRDEIPSDTLA